MERSKRNGKFTIKRYQIPIFLFLLQHVKEITTVLDQERGFSLSETQVMVNCEEESNLLSKGVKSFLIEEFGHNIKFSESERKNESQFIFPAAAKVEDVINSLFDTNAVKSAAQVIK